MADRRQSADVSPAGPSGTNGHVQRNGTTSHYQHTPAWNTPARARNASDAFSASLRASATTFQPAGPADFDQVSRSMRMLSVGSTVDDAPTIVSSTPVASNKTSQEPIGTKGSGNNSPVRQKGFFSTDVNPDKPAIGGHFLMIQGLKSSELDEGVVTVVEHEYATEILGKKLIIHGDDDTEVDMMLYIDDLRKSRKIIMDLDSFGTITVSLVSHDWYANGIKASGHDPKSMYVGQLTLVAEFKGRTADYNGDHDVWEKVKAYVDSSGDVLAFEQNKAAPYPTWQFRVEFYKASDAEKLLAAAKEPTKLGETKGWFISAKQYAPPGHDATAMRPTSSHASTTSSVNTAVIPHGATLFTSPTGRTSWFTDGDGKTHALPTPATSSDSITAVQGTPVGTELVRYDTQPLSTPRGLHGPRYNPDYGFQEMDDHTPRDRGQLADVSVERILQGYDVRTTVMLRNVPNDWQWQDVRALLDDVVPNRFNFMYLRIDFKVGKNVGYAFVNFENAMDIVKVVQAFVGKPWDAHGRYGGGHQPKTIQLSYATIQGIDSLIDKFRNSSVMDEMLDYRPLLLQTPEEYDKDKEEARRLAERGLSPPPITPVGQRKNFPLPNNRAKKERSTANAALLGLFTPRRALQGDRQYRSQYDRGTPAQLLEESHFNGFGPYGSPGYMFAPPMTNYTYGPPRGQGMLPPGPLSPGFPAGFTGFMSAPAAQSIMPRSPFGPATPSRSFTHMPATIARPEYDYQDGGVPVNGRPVQWHGPAAEAGLGFSPGHDGMAAYTNGGAPDMVNGRGHPST